jgi:chloride channel protein, CIC family
MLSLSADQSPTAVIGQSRSWKDSNSSRIFFTAAIVGVISGLICVSVRFGLRFLQWLITGHAGLLADAASHLPLWRRVLTPILGAILATVIVKVARTYLHIGKSVDYVEAVRFHQGRIPFQTTLWRTISSAFSIASGAAIGREGSMIQFAAASIAALGLRWNGPAVNLNRLVALGTAAAVAAVYQAPLAGVFFALEIVLGLKSFSRTAFIQIPALLVSAGAGALMSYLFLGGGPLFPVTTAVQFNWHDGLPILLGAVIIGGFGPVYSRIIEGLRLMKNLPWAMVWSGLVVGLLSCLRPEIWGNGDSGVLDVMSVKISLETAVIVLILRLVATAACVGSGVIGGVFTPTVFAGSVLGLLYGSFVPTLFHHASPAIGYAVLGIVCLLASVTHAPFMAALMTVELTGTLHWFPVVFLCSLVSLRLATTISPDSLYDVATPDSGRNCRPSKTTRAASLPIRREAAHIL